MKNLTTILLLTVWLITPVYADVSNDCANALTLPADTIFESKLDYEGDVDWYRVLIPERKLLVIMIIPDASVDILFSEGPDCHSWLDRIDYCSYGAMEISSMQHGLPSIDCVFKVEGRGIGDYKIKLTTVDRGAPITYIEMRYYNYPWGSDFWFEVILINTSHDASNMDIYILLDFEGAFYYWPNWTTLANGKFNVGMRAHSMYFIHRILNFTVPDNYPILGPLRIYAAVYNRTNGLWSNICWVRWYFTAD